jgi:primosomal protein N' (replication factor Y)
MLSSGSFAPHRPLTLTRGLRKIDLASALMIFADVAIETTTRELANRLFTYEVPEHLRDEVFVGSQVLVPFGQQELICGYVISLRDSMAIPASEQPDFTIKPILEIMESEPLFDPAYVSFLHWVADYYSASILDVINAAVPSDISTRVKRIARLLDAETGETAAEPGPTDSESTPEDGGSVNLQIQFEGQPELAQNTGAARHSQQEKGASGQSREQRLLVELLQASKGGAMAVKTLKQRSGITQSRFYSALSRLRKAGVLEIQRESDNKNAPKIVQTVIATGEEAQTPKQEQILTALKRGGGQMNMTKLAEASGTAVSTIKRMCTVGVLQLVQDEVIRDPLAHLKKSNGFVLPDLTQQQTKVMETLSKQLTECIQSTPLAEAEPVLPWLLHGVTGSGKTEIYLRLIDQALEQKRSVLMLVPEISLTPQLAQRLVQRFGDMVAVWHSGLSAGERFDTWRRLKGGQARVLLGARSAILANLPDLGLIILDEEHDSSYKQSSPSPRYHAKTAAIERARRTGAMVLLGSATPDVATYYESRLVNRIVELPERVFQQALPQSIIVDMRMEFTAGNRSVFSRILQERVTASLSRNEQVILLMNRRGYASHVFCRACGFVMKCRNCSVSLVFHQEPGRVPEVAATTTSSSSRSTDNLKSDDTPYSPYNQKAREAANRYNRARADSRGPFQGRSNGGSMGGTKAPARPIVDGFLICHHCAFTCPVAQTCSSCQSPFIRQFGLGTQRVEQEVRELFPSARMLRLDSDITSRRGAYEEVFNKFVEGQADILIGTQIVAKGLDIPRVTLVGVLAADASFNLPDYRSGERGYQLLTQVSGRAGRGHDAGSVILQTYTMDLPALTLARNQDYAPFYDQEIEGRRAFEYPPFSQIIRVVIAGENLPEVEAACEQLAEELSTYLEDRFDEDKIKILGPAPCLIERLRSKYRQHLLIKNLAGDEGHKCIAQFLRLRRGGNGLTIAVDIDAIDLV